MCKLPEFPFDFFDFFLFLVFSFKRRIGDQEDEDFFVGAVEDMEIVLIIVLDGLEMTLFL